MIASIACGIPSDDEVAAAFKKDHPTYTVISCGVGEGDGSAAYFQIKYKKPCDKTVHEDEWQYLKSGDKWVLNNKESIK